MAFALVDDATMTIANVVEEGGDGGETPPEPSMIEGMMLMMVMMMMLGMVMGQMEGV